RLRQRLQRAPQLDQIAIAVVPLLEQLEIADDVLDIHSCFRLKSDTLFAWPRPNPKAAPAPSRAAPALAGARPSRRPPVRAPALYDSNSYCVAGDRRRMRRERDEHDQR